MKLALISDTHFGDPMCQLVEKDGASGYVIGPKYRDFKKEVGTNNEYLILVGDIFDFSVVSYSEAYEAAKVFFSQIAVDKIAHEIIYVPGNHDFDFWHWVENDVNVIKRIQDKKPPRDFRWSVPGLIDDRTNTKREGLYLYGVTRQAGKHPYGGLFLDKLTNEKIPFSVAYPNIYLVNDSITIMITHGQYLELYWSLMGEFGPKVLGGDLAIGGFLDLKELVAVNFPTNQLASSGVGQAGPLTDWIRYVQRRIKDRELEVVERYLNNLDKHILDPAIAYKRFDPREWLSDKGIDMAKKRVLKMIGNMRETRYSEEFIRDPAVQERFKKYYLASVAEIDLINEEYGYNTLDAIPYPKHVVFGHTHRPIPWDDNHLKTRIEGTRVRLHNAGGWLCRKDEHGDDEFVGAEVFLYKDGKMNSVRIS